MSEATAATGLNKARARVFDDIRALVEKADPNSWKKMWIEIGTSVPRSATSNRPYRGYNRWRLLVEAQAKGWRHRWLTLGQIRKLGGRVKDGEFLNPTIVELWAPRKPKVQESDSADKPKKTKARKKASGKAVRPSFGNLLYRWYRVWNVDQCEGLPDAVAEGPKVTLQDCNVSFEKVDHLVQASGADVQYGHDRACYSPSLDRVLMPLKAQYQGESEEDRAANFYATLLHEMGHWTGHETRNNRPFGMVFGSEQYAREELVAELASAFLCADLGVPRREMRHPEYLANWLQAIKDDPSALTKAASDAAKASSFLMAFLGETQAPDEEEAQDEQKADATSEESPELEAETA